MANPPPPYDNITGISRAVMKDNAQETLANYNGNARPGEIVADLTTDPPALYVGNNAGLLTAIATGGGGNAGLPLANGSSNFDIATINGNVTITAGGSNIWTFNTNSVLAVAGNIDFGGDSSAAPSLNDFFSVTSAVDFSIVTDSANTDQTWTFDNTGNLGLPGGGILYGNPYTPSGSPGNTITLQPAGSGIITDQKLLVYPTAADGDHIHLTSGNLYQTELFFGNDNLYVKLANTGNIVINSNDNTGNTAQWTFGANGVLTLPYSAVIKTTSDSAIAIGVGAGTGGSSAVSLGSSAGANAQSFDAIAIGGQAGANTQGGGAIAIGGSAGNDTQGAGAIAIGPNAGQFSQGTLAIAIGASAGYNVQASSTIVINATGSQLDNQTANSLVVAPVRNDVANVGEVLFYNNNTKEITYANVISPQQVTATNNFQLPVYANATVRDSSVTSPQPGMMIYVTGTGMQVRGATSWNTIAGSGT